MFVVSKKSWGYMPASVWHEGDSQWWYDYTVGIFETRDEAQTAYDGIKLDENTCEKKIVRINKDDPIKGDWTTSSITIVAKSVKWDTWTPSL